MDTEKRSDDQEQLEEHSLPGTNQAGRGPGDARDEADERALERSRDDKDGESGRDQENQKK